MVKEKKDTIEQQKNNRKSVAFKKVVKKFEEENGLRNLPWRKTRDPYQIAISELMLQQTQVDRVLPKYHSFLETFPTVTALATARVAAVLEKWSGLGYNRRALFVKRMAERVVAEFGGVFPKEVTALESLPGIGPYTARAICAFAHNQPVVLIEANIRRVYLHHFFTDVSEKISDQELLPIIQATLETKNPRHWYNLLMDYGTYLKKQGSVIHKKSTHYQKQKKFSGSIREARGKILKILIFGALSKKALQQKTDLSKEHFEVALLQLQKEGFLVEKHERFSLANT